MLVPAKTGYHRWLGWHAPAWRRLLVAGCAGLITAAAMSRFTSWLLVLLSGWDVAALVFLMTVWLTIIHADGASTEALATREDLSRDTARLLLLAASGTSLVAVAMALSQARQATGARQAILITVATATVAMSWTVVNTVFALRYADLHYSSRGGTVDFGEQPDGEKPDYRDFAYLAFTIGMTYQVSDTAVRDKALRRSVLQHSLLSYLFGVVIVATGVNIIAGLAR
jgi:uncharacterized membrane protein